MIFDLSNQIDIQEFKSKSEYLISKGKKVELKQKRETRTKSQNRYLHVILSYGGLQLGYTLEEFKMIFKSIICKDIFEYQKKKIKFYKSTSELDTKEMTIAIETYRNYMSKHFNIYIASPNEDTLISQLESEIRRYGNRQYL